MTAEELSKALYEKLMQEQEQYAEWLKTQPPDVILKHAYEYAVREDIVLLLEYNEPTEQEARALLQEHNVIEKSCSYGRKKKLPTCRSCGRQWSSMLRISCE